MVRTFQNIKFRTRKLIKGCAEVTSELEYIANKLRRQWQFGEWT